MTAFKPEPHILLIVRQSTLLGSPANNAACRAGAWPRPAERTLPMITSSTTLTSIPVSSNIAFMATAPSLGAETEAKLP